MLQYVPIGRFLSLAFFRRSELLQNLFRLSQLSQLSQGDEFVQLAEVLSDHQPSGDVSQLRVVKILKILNTSRPSHGPSDFVKISVS